MIRLFSVALGNRRGQVMPLPTPQSIWQWAVRHREALWIVALVLLSALAHGYNIFRFPYYESDEGTSMSQAWAVVRLQALAPYTYWYDHAPGGWLQIAVWSLLTGGFYTFDTPINSGRVLMLLMHIGSTFMVYRIARTASGGVAAPTIAVLLFALSAYGTYYHRRVLLDNMATFWMLVSITLVVVGRLSLKRVWFSAVALGISALSKELTVFLIPVMAYLVFHRADRAQRGLAVIGWLAVVGSVGSTYLLMAALKGELFPYGSPLGGDQPHVSLIGSLQYQSSREKDAGLLDLDSNVWNAIRTWREEEPLLLIGGSIAAILSMLLAPWWRLAAILGGLTLSLWAFIGRGGVTLPFYLVPLLPLLAINLGLVVGGAADLLARRLTQRKTTNNQPEPVVVERARAVGDWRSVVSSTSAPARVSAPVVRRQSSVAGLGRSLLGRGLQVGAVVGCLAFVPLGYRNPYLEFRSDPMVLWRSGQADVHKQVSDWVIANVPRDSKIIIDQSMYLELRDIPGQPPFEHAHYYWKVKEDPEVRTDVFKDDWRTVDYVITTNQLIGDTGRTKDPITGTALENSTLVASFDTGGWPIEVRQVHAPEPDGDIDTLLQTTWQSYRTVFIEDGRVIDRGNQQRTTSEGQSYAMLRSVLIDDRATFDQVWDWTKANLQQEDGLFTWRWQPEVEDDKRDNGTATDADQDIALALLFASKRWAEPRYQQEALRVLDGIWTKETSVVNGRRVLVAGNWARGDIDGTAAVINPSYFAPYAYRIFAEADPRRPWVELTDTSYTVLAQIRQDARFGGESGLVPNWLALDRQTGDLQRATYFGRYADEYSYDAARLPWRVGLDWLWYKDARAKDALEGFDFLAETYRRDGRLAAEYNLDGTADVPFESISMYAGAIGSLMFDVDRNLSRHMYDEKIEATLQEDGQLVYWGNQDSYYDQNWAWFATALLNNRFENLWER